MSDVLDIKQKLQTEVKICGIKRVDEIAILNEYPVSYAGFIFAKSKRHISKEKAKVLMERLRPDIKPIGVFVNPDIAELIETIRYCNLYGVQLHGDMIYDLDFAKKLKRLIISRDLNLKVVWKSISVGKGIGDFTKNLEKNDTGLALHLQEAREFEPYVDGILFDTYRKGEKGGTGEVFNWNELEDYDLDPKMILAGGLNPDNIVDAINTVKPAIVDVNSGLEVKYIKQHDKVDRLFKALYTLDS